jgi:hypothetical protein
VDQYKHFIGALLAMPPYQFWTLLAALVVLRLASLSVRVFEIAAVNGLLRGRRRRRPMRRLAMRTKERGQGPLRAGLRVR